VTQTQPHRTAQSTLADPRTQYEQPQTDGRTIPGPGATAQMDEQPDHGELSYRGCDRLVGRRCLVTGGDSGIGRAVAIAFAREGADVALTYLPEEAADAEETASWVERAGRRAVALEADLRGEAACAEVVRRTLVALGGLEVLVVNAAYQHSQDEGLPGFTTPEMERVFRTNVFAMVWLAQAALPHLAPGATIITTSSVQAFRPSPHLLDYAMSKAAIVSFTKSMSEQLLDRGIRVNSVAPGPVWTPLIPATMDEDRVESFGEQAPLGRAAQPAEIAPAYVFLASNESAYISGEVIAVTGGTPIV
jgi:NAD(P)-dependent dehydrogenase (short-subunit alcohol dehydrogenase family)